MFIKKSVKILLNTLYLTNNLINIYNKNLEYKKTASKHSTINITPET